jgi:hypothetical protein
MIYCDICSLVQVIDFPRCGGSESGGGTGAGDRHHVARTCQVTKLHGPSVENMQYIV